MLMVHLLDVYECRLQSQLSEKEIMVSKVQPELLRQCSVNRLLGTNSVALHDTGVSAHGSEVMHMTVFGNIFAMPYVDMK